MARTEYKYDETASVNVWVGNLAAYNAGFLVGDWVALPVDDVDDAIMAACGVDTMHDEYHIPDWECSIPGLEYNEYYNLEDLNEIVAEWDNLHDWEREAVGVRMSLCGEGFREAIDHADDVRIWYGCADMSDVAAEYVDECGMLESMPENLRYYFDYAALGRDLQIEGCFDYSDELGCMVEAW